MSGQSPEQAAKQSVSQRLAARIHAPVSADDRARAARALLDWTGCAIAGATGRAGRTLAKLRGGLSPDDALATGALGNVLEMDDVDKRALLHPGPVVVPAALAAARETGASSKALLDALVAGYEAMIRIGRAVGPAHYRFFHNTATSGPFGAAAAAARLYRLDTDRTARALGLAGTQTGGLWQTRNEPDNDAKQLHAGRAAESGLLAARLVRDGFVGLLEIFEGPQGVFAALCGGADAEAVVAFEAGAPFAIHDVSVKPWPACRHAHAAIDAALAARAQGIAAADVKSVRARVYRDAALFCDKPSPADAPAARFSLQHAVAVALVKGAPALADFEGAALTDPALAAMRARIAVAVDPAFDARYPARFGAALDLDTARGRVTIEIPDALGDPENPVTDDQIRAKALTLMAAGGLSAREAEALADGALSLAEGGAAADYFIRLERALAR